MIANELINELSQAEKYVLLLLYAGNKGVKGSLWFQKEMFELTKSFKELAEELDFSAYSYGPFSESLLEIKDMLENSGLITKSENRLILTEDGEKIAEILWKKTKNKIKKIILEIKNFFEGLDWEELLLYIYVTSPKMTDKSVKYNEIMSKRFKIALRMLLENKVSLEKAAKLAGLPLKKFRQYVINMGIKLFTVLKEDLEEGVEK